MLNQTIKNTQIKLKNEVSYAKVLLYLNFIFSLCCVATSKFLRIFFSYCNMLVFFIPILRLSTNAFKFITQHISIVPNLVYVEFQRNKESIRITMGRSHLKQRDANKNYHHIKIWLLTMTYVYKGNAPNACNFIY